MSFRYIYEIELCLAAAQLSLNMKEKKGVIQNAVVEFNSRCNRMSNKKTITLKTVSKDSFVVCLESDLPLETPGRALKTLSMLLLKEPDFANAVTSSGQLFRTVQKPKASSEGQGSIKYGISDLDAVKILMDYVYSAKDKNKAVNLKQRDAMERIKAIILEELQSY